MSSVKPVIKEPFKHNFCENCHFYATLNNESRVCGLNVHTPIRKIEECDDYISKEYADQLEAAYLRSRAGKCGN